MFDLNYTLTYIMTKVKKPLAHYFCKKQAVSCENYLDFCVNFTLSNDLDIVLQKQCETGLSTLKTGKKEAL